MAVETKARLVGATGWLEALPRLVAELEELWSLELESVYPDGTEALVAAVHLEDGGEAVLKVVLPQRGDPAGAEISFLELAAGRGCAELFRADRERGALLLEKLGPSLSELGRPFLERDEILVATASQIWRPVEQGTFTDGATKGASLSSDIERRYAELDRPVSGAALQQALACAERRIAAHRPERSFLVHGDVHQWNALRAADGFKLVDPDGLAMEREYDLGTIMREDPLEMIEGDPTKRAVRLASLAGGLDPVAIWEWSCVERLSTGLLLLQIGMEEIGRDMLAVVERIAREGYELGTA